MADENFVGVTDVAENEKLEDSGKIESPINNIEEKDPVSPKYLVFEKQMQKIIEEDLFTSGLPREFILFMLANFNDICKLANTITMTLIEKRSEQAVEDFLDTLREIIETHKRNSSSIEDDDISIFRNTSGKDKVSIRIETRGDNVNELIPLVNELMSLPEAKSLYPRMFVETGKIPERFGDDIDAFQLAVISLISRIPTNVIRIRNTRHSNVILIGLTSLYPEEGNTLIAKGDPDALFYGTKLVKLGSNWNDDGRNKQNQDGTKSSNQKMIPLQSTGVIQFGDDRRLMLTLTGPKHIDPDKNYAHLTIGMQMYTNLIERANEKRRKVEHLNIDLVLSRKIVKSNSNEPLYMVFPKSFRVKFPEPFSAPTLDKDNGASVIKIYGTMNFSNIERVVHFKTHEIQSVEKRNRFY